MIYLMARTNPSQLRSMVSTSTNRFEGTSMPDSSTKNLKPAAENDVANQVQDLPQKPNADREAPMIKGGSDMKTGVANITKKGN